MKRFLAAVLRNEHGATMVEYGILAGFIAAVCFAAVKTLGQHVVALYTNSGVAGAL